jgi:uncharacterized OB-fold protein
MIEMNTPAKPIPHPNDLSRPYWDAAARGQLVLQSCTACGKIRHYPRLLCDACWSDAVEWKPSHARGRIHSWTVAHHAFHAAFADELPYVLVTVDLEEGVRALGRWRGGDPVVGVPVIGSFEQREGAADLYFMPATP